MSRFAPCKFTADKFSDFIIIIIIIIIILFIIIILIVLIYVWNILYY